MHDSFYLKHIVEHLASTSFWALKLLPLHGTTNMKNRYSTYNMGYYGGNKILSSNIKQIE